MADEWDVERREIGDGILRFGFGQSAIAGTQTIEAIRPRYPMPFGVLWFSHVGVRLMEIENVFVHENFRRLGVGTMLVRRLLDSFEGTQALITGAGTADGVRWLEALGFRRSKTLGWILHRSRLEAK